MIQLSGWLNKIAKGWLAILFTVLMIAFMIWVLPDQSAKAEAYSGEAGSPDTSFFYPPEKLFQMAEAYGEEGRQAYIRARFTFDLIFPLVYGGFLVAVIGWFLTRSTTAGSRVQLLNLIPLAGVLFDYLENIAASLVMGVYPIRLGWAAVLGSIFTVIKWLFVYGSFILLPGVMILWLIRRNKLNTQE